MVSPDTRDREHVLTSIVQRKLTHPHAGAATYYERYKCVHDDHVQRHMLTYENLLTDSTHAPPREGT